MYIYICKDCSSLPNHTVLLIVSYPRVMYVEYELLYICMYVGMYKKVAGGWLHAALQHCRLIFLKYTFCRRLQLHMYVLICTILICTVLNEIK